METLHFVPDETTSCLKEQDAKRYFSIVGFAVFSLAAINFAAQFLLAFLCGRLLPDWIIGHPLFSFALSTIPLYCIAFPVFFLILKRLPEAKPLSQPMKAGQWFGGLCVAFTMMMAGNYISQFLISWIELMTGTTQQNPVESMTQNSAWWMNLIFIAILAPILEELVFRKILCNRLLPLGEGYAIVLSAAAFGLCHGNFFQFFYAFALGCLFALIYVKTGKIIYSMLYHAVINLLGGVFAPWLLGKLDLEALTKYLEDTLENGTADLTAIQGQLPYLLLLSAYSFLQLGAAITGLVLLIKATKKYHLEAGLLPPPKKKRVSLVFLNAGVAASLAFFAFLFLFSIFF